MFEKGRAGRGSTKPITHCLRSPYPETTHEVGRPHNDPAGGETDPDGAQQTAPLLTGYAVQCTTPPTNRGAGP